MKSAITGKGLRDEESAEMLDIILASTVYDLARMYDYKCYCIRTYGQYHRGQGICLIFAKREKKRQQKLWIKQ